MLANALIVGIVLAATKFFDWYGNTMFQRPIFCVAILGALLGHPTEGIILAAELELVFLGNVSLGGVMPSDFTLGSIFGAAFALLLGKDLATAVTLALPLAALGTLLYSSMKIVVTSLVPKFEDLIEKRNIKGLYVLNIGALTDLAVALLEEPKITSKMTAIWVGGGRYPKGSKECNLGNDLIAANYVFASELPLWQIPSNVYKTTLVSLAQLKLRVAPMGKLGNYLYEQLITFMKTNAKEKSWINPECWVMGDSGAIGVLLEEQKSYYQEIIAPIFDEEHHYIYNQKNRKIRVYQQLNNYFVIEDMLSKIELFASEGKRWHF